MQLFLCSIETVQVLLYRITISFFTLSVISQQDCAFSKTLPQQIPSVRICRCLLKQDDRYNGHKVAVGIKVVHLFFYINIMRSLLRLVHCAMQGLFEYVRPSWEERPRPKVGEFDMKSFGSTTPDRPTATNIAVTELQIDGTVLPV